MPKQPLSAAIRLQNSTGIRRVGSIRLFRQVCFFPVIVLPIRDRSTNVLNRGRNVLCFVRRFNLRRPTEFLSHPNSCAIDMAVTNPRLPAVAANFYELLDLSPFETDIARIQERVRETAKDLRKYQVGPYAAQAEACLNRVAAAKRCLLDPSQKAKYDEQLRDELDLPPMTVRSSWSPMTGERDAATRQRNPLLGIIARGLHYPFGVWHSFQRLLARPSAPEVTTETDAASELESVGPVADPPTVAADSPWVTIPLTETASVPKAS